MLLVLCLLETRLTGFQMLCGHIGVTKWSRAKREGLQHWAHEVGNGSELLTAMTRLVLRAAARLHIRTRKIYTKKKEPLQHIKLIAKVDTCS